jgi:diguanylate cyclase (GGDEF)-like protein/PAS domain S-box-containing protein
LASPGKKSRNIATSAPGADHLLAASIRHAPIGAALLSDDFRVLAVNDAFYDLISAEPGDDLLPHIHAEDRESLKFHVTRHRLTTRNASNIEIRIFDLDNVERWMLAGISPGESEPASAVLLWLVDIDHGKREAMERRKWEERWNSALVSSTLGVWDHDFRNGSMYYSDTWKLIRGMQPDEDVEAATSDWILSVHPDDRAHVLEWIRRQNEGEVSSAVFEYREKRKDGNWIWIECRGSCIEWDADGKPCRIVGTDLDITERKATEAMLAHVQRRLELALEATQIGVFEADVTAGTVLFDDRLLAMMDLIGEPHHMGGQDWEHIIHPDDRGAAQERIHGHVQANEPFSNQFRIIRKDGSIRHIRARAAPFEDESGHQKYIGANWDVTADVTIREELERAKSLAEARNRELEATRAKVEHNALHDFLTDLPNRRYLDEKLAGLGSGADCGLAVLHIDLDRFKQINDTLGHQAGDFMLLHAARVLRENTGGGEFVARIGGDEFVILTDVEGGSDRLAGLADRIIRQMREPVHYGGITCRIGASIGIACDPRAEIDAKQLLLNADIALYRAKSRGRNRHEFFSIDIQHQVINNKRVSDEILAALERSEFVPHYQLQFSARDLSIAGVETLARWQHPTKGLLAPDTFLTIAEDLDVVAAIDAMIFEKAHADFLAWRTSGIAIPKVSVNVSTRRLYDPDLGEKLARLPIMPGTVSFELLESIFLDDCDDTVADNLEIMRRMGIGIEIDDFGSGHASIISLLKIGPGTLKIDRELVMPIVEAEEKSRLVGSIIEIGKSLNIRVLAEGVETAKHIRILQKLGCDALQGYALARPMPFERIEPFVREGKWRGEAGSLDMSPSPAKSRR